MHFPLACLVLVLLTASAGRAAEAKAPENGVAGATTDAEANGFYVDYIAPILSQHCFECHSHSASKSKGGLVLDSRNAILAGGSTGPAAKPGDPQASLLIQLVKAADPDERMPPKTQLSAEQVSNLKRWVEMGLPVPASAAPAAVGPPVQSKLVSAEELWSLKPVKDAAVPQVRDAAWPRNDVDRFVLARLEREGLQPVGDAPSALLLRRVHFALTGLPPTPQDVEKFIADPSPAALEAVVDTLLASPRFGERWGRHWLDTARYADSNGGDRDRVFRYAWRYRNWVIDAANADLPYDQFLTQQIAGDLLPAASWQEGESQQLATGFLALGTKPLAQYKAGTDELKPGEAERVATEWAAEQIAAVMRGTMAMTVDCARCHDHKFDPIPTTDYYGLAGIFYSTELRFTLPYFQFVQLKHHDFPFEGWLNLTGDPAEVAVARQLVDKWHRLERRRLDIESEGRQKNAKTDAASADARMRHVEAEIKALQEKAKALKTVQHAIGASDASTVRDVRVEIKGDYQRLGELVPRRFLSAVQFSGTPTIAPITSGRLELAQWITHPANPLTARVAVNRVWYRLFNRGLVTTLDNFGVMGDTPSHPELLDHLAHRFVHTHQWSTKKLIRELILSRAFQLASTPDEKNMQADPDNSLLWRQGPRRLEAEAMRDTMLSLAGQLDVARPRGSPVTPLPYGNQATNRERSMVDAEEMKSYRGVYLPIIRTQLTKLHMLFDLPDSTVVASDRFASTVPTQGLYLMNSPWMRQRAEAMAKRLRSGDDLADDAARIRQAYLLAFATPASDADIELELKVLREAVKAGRSEQDAWTDFCHAIMMSPGTLYLH